MRRVGLVWSIAFSTAVAIESFHSPTAQAQSGSVKAIFEKYDLLGVFAGDCSKPVSKDNLYYANRLLDPDHVQRDQMEGPTTRSWLSIIDKATETGRNQIALSGQLNGRPADGIWRIEQGRVMVWEATLEGQKRVADGKLVATGQQMPWLNKCGP